MMSPLRTDNFDFELPEELIAQTPVEPRDHARLLFSHDQELSDHHVYDLPMLLRRGDLLILNNTKVIPARLRGQRGSVKIEVLLHKKSGDKTWLAFARPGKRLKEGTIIQFTEELQGTVLAKKESGEVELEFSQDSAAFMETLLRIGEPPLPPYIRRQPGTAVKDAARYQTTYAHHDGSVAAPTAGLHFTPELLKNLEDHGIHHVFVTLHVGAGTFLPVKADLIQDHVMHAEWGSLSKATALKLNQAKKEGRRLVAVGTTSLRLLETASDHEGTLHPFEGDTKIFIYPGYRFKVVDALMTNFHLPKSTLFMLVSAFAGTERARQIYDYAIAKKYRFYSYGDSMLVERA